MKKNIKDRSSVFHFVVMVAFGAFPFYFGTILVKTFWDFVPAINKAKWSDFLTWQFALLLGIYVVFGSISFMMALLSKCHYDLLSKRLKTAYLGSDKD